MKRFYKTFSTLILFLGTVGIAQAVFYTFPSISAPTGQNPSGKLLVGSSTGLYAPSNLILASTTIGDGTGAGGLTVSGTATTTNLGILAILSCSGSSALTTNALGQIVCGSITGGGGTYPFSLAGNATSSLTQFNGGLTAYASTTIGNGTQTGGLTVSGTASSTNFILLSAIGSAGCATLSAQGLLSSTGSACGSGGGGSFPFSADTNYGQVVYSTSTPTLWLKSGLFASSTSHFVNASSTQQTIFGSLWLPSLTSGGLAVDAAGLVYKAATTTAGTGLTYSGNAFSVNTSQNIATLSNLTGNGFVITSGGVGTLSVDTTTYESGLTAGDGLTRTANDFDCDTASGSVFGCLSSTDWTTFNNKSGFAYPFLLNATSTTLTFSGGLVSNGSTTISGLASGLVGNNNGLLYGFASSSLFGYTPLNPTRALTINGTANQLTSSAGAQDLSTDRTWTLSLPSLVIFPGQASTTQLSAGRAYFGSTATTTIDTTGNIVIPSGSSLTNTGVSDGCGTWASGVLGSTGSACGAGGGGSYPFPLAGNATSTLTQFNGGLTAYASTTVGAGGQTTGLTISGGATTTGNLRLNGTTGITLGTSGAGIRGAGGGGLTINASSLLESPDSLSYMDISNAGISFSSSGFKSVGSASSYFYLEDKYATGFPTLASPNQSGTFALASTSYSGVWQDFTNNRFSVGSSSPYTKLSVHANNGETNTTLFAIASSTASATTTHFVINNTGNVGVGSTTPSSQLSILGNGVSSILALYTSAATKVIEILETGVVTLLGAWDFGGATSLEIPNGTGNTVDATGECAWDTTDDQFVCGDSAGTARVIAHDEFKIKDMTIASTSLAFVSGGLLPIGSNKDGLELTQYRCYVTSGTSVVLNITDGTTNDTETITCTTSVVSDTDVATNDTFTADEIMRLEFGTITGAVDYVHFEVYARITRE